MTQEEAKKTLIENGYFPEISTRTQEDFLNACKDRKLEVVNAYVALGMSLECRADWGEQTPLVKAAEGNDVEIALLLLAAGADIENKDGDGDTALHTAANWGNFEVLKALHQKGAKVDTVNNSDYTPLTGALKNDHSEIFEYLLQYANPNLFPEEYGALAQFCMYQHHENELKTAFQKGAIRPDPNLQDKYGDPLLIYAVKKDNDTVLKMLIENGADLNVKNSADWTPYYFALFEKKTSMAKLLKSGSDLNCGKDVYDFCVAVQKKDTKTLETILANGADIHTRNGYGQNAICMASEKGKEDFAFVEWLISKGADIHAKDLYGTPVVETLIGQEKIEMAKMLLLKGANPNREDDICHLWYSVFDKGNTELAQLLLDAGANIQDLGEIKLALEYGSGSSKKMIEVIQLLGKRGANFDILDKTISDSLLGELAGRLKSDKVVALVEAGADVNLKDKNNYTPLNKLASAYDSNKKEAYTLAKFLLENGASLEIEGNFGGTPGYNAESQKNKHVLKAIEEFIRKPLTDAMLKYGVTNLPEAPDAFIQEFSATQNTGTLMEWVRWKEYKVVELLLKGGVSPNPKTQLSMETPLYLAVKENDHKMVAILLKSGADPNYEMRYGSHCLSTAAYCKEKSKKKANQTILKLLIQHGVNVNRLSDYKENAIGSAVSSGNRENAEILLAAGTELNAYPCGWSPLMRAVQAGDLEMTEWLLEKKASLNNVNNSRKNALHLAIDKELTEIALVLMEDKINIHQPDDKGETPLIMAVKKGNEALIEALLKLKADPNHKDTTGQSALIYASHRKNLKSHFSKFASAKSDEELDTFTVFDKIPLTPLLTAIYMREVETVRELVENGADLNAPNYRGDTPLLVALFTAQPEIAAILMEKGANLNGKNKWKDEAYGICLAFNFDESKAILEAKGVKISMDFLNQMAGIQMRMEAAQKLMKSGDVTGFDKCLKDGEMDIHVWSPYSTPLHQAVERNDEAIVALLLKRGANPYFPNYYGSRPIDITENAEISDMLADYMKG